MTRPAPGDRLRRLAPLLLWLAVVGGFSAVSERYFTLANALNILVQAAPLALMAIGASMVLLVGGIDLSAGALLYLAGVIVVKALPADAPAVAALAAVLATGLAVGALNALLVVRLRMVPFVATLATMFALRGTALRISGSEGLPVPAAVSDLARATIGPLPLPLALAFLAILLAAAVLRTTPFGRQALAVGADREAARAAGIAVVPIAWLLHLGGSATAALGGFVALTQVGYVTAAFGDGMEFLAVAAAVLGGASLAGGRGVVFGPVGAALWIQAVQSGLVMAGADPYAHPLAAAGCLFVAVAADALRRQAGRGRHRSFRSMESKQGRME